MERANGPMTPWICRNAQSPLKVGVHEMKGDGSAHPRRSVTAARILTFSDWLGGGELSSLGG